MRPSGRELDEMRDVSIETGFTKHAEGSCLIKMGDTHVLCTATIEDRVPPFHQRVRSGLGYRRIRNAAPRNEHADAPRSAIGQARRAHR